MYGVPDSTKDILHGVIGPSIPAESATLSDSWAILAIGGMNKSDGS